MRPVSVSGLVGFDEMVVFSTRTIVCPPSRTMLSAKSVISSTELASPSCWRLLVWQFLVFLFWFLHAHICFFFTRLLFSSTLHTSSFTEWPSDLICVFEALLALQMLMQRWSVNCCCCNNRLRAPQYLIPSMILSSATYWSIDSPSCCSYLLNR